jgi:hypothetical protein
MPESEQNIKIVLQNSDEDDDDNDEDDEDIIDIILGFENFAPVNFKKNKKKIERFQNNNNEDVSTGSCKDPYSFQGYQNGEYALI